MTAIVRTDAVTRAFGRGAAARSAMRGVTLEVAAGAGDGEPGAGR